MSLENRSFRMPEALSVALDNTAHAKGMNASQVVRLALRAYFQEEIRLSNERLPQAREHVRRSVQARVNATALELSNQEAADLAELASASASDADLVTEWSRFYGDNLRTA